MTPQEIALARRIVALGLPVPTCVKHYGALTVRDSSGEWVDIGAGGTIRGESGLLFAWIPGPELLPVLTDFALLGWLITEARRRLGEPHLRTRWSKSGQRWEVYGDSVKWRNVVGSYAGFGDTEVEALTVALEAVKEAAK